jgi:tetratricopeptide (TPR) repeat protein
MLVDKGWWDRSLIILLSDHGESLGDHGETSHGYFIYQSTLWVPLLIHFPKDAQTQPVKVSEPGGLIDVAPTILDFLHINQPASFRGVSLLKQVTIRNVYSESMYAHDAFRWSPLRSLRIGNYQYIDAPVSELYNLASNPHEMNNVIQTNAAVARDQRVALRTLLAKNSTKHALVTRDTSSATTNALRSLGYVATGDGAVPASSGPDPKERLREYQDYEKGLEALYSHREAQAVTIFEAILHHDSDCTIARYYLGEAYLRLNRRDDAIREWKAALSSDPSYAPAAEALRSLSH